MSEQKDRTDFTDPLAVAVEITALQGMMSTLQHSVSSTSEHLTQSMRDLQSEVRQAVSQLREVARIQHVQETQSSGLERAFEAIRHLAEQQEKSWKEHTQESDKWRNGHVKDDQKTRETLIRWSGMGLAASALIGTIVLLSIYIASGWVQHNEQMHQSLEMEMRSQDTTMSERINKVEKYLIAEGVRRNTPFDEASQNTQDKKK